MSALESYSLFYVLDSLIGALELDVNQTQTVESIRPIWFNVDRVFEPVLCLLQLLQLLVVASEIENRRQVIFVNV